jgi:hypothetical protein
LKEKKYELQKELFLCTFLLIEKYQKIKTANKSAPTFLNVRKVAKEACTLKELLEFSCVTLKRINSLRSNTIRFLTLHSRKFFNPEGTGAILLMCGCQSRRNRLTIRPTDF